MNFIRLTAFVAVTVIAFACTAKYDAKKDEAGIAHTDGLAKAEKPGEEKEFFAPGFAADTAAQQSPGEDQQKQQQRQQPGPPLAKQDWDKKIIKTAVLNLEVKEYKTFYASIREKVKAAGGYIAQEEQTQTGYKIENSLTIKVPVDQLDDAVAQLALNTERINEKKISSQDVTTEMVDTKSRMEAKKQVRLRYMDLLKQAKNMEEVLSVQSEINAVQEEIESAAGRINYLGHSSTFSTIHLTYYQILNLSAKDSGSPSFGTQLGSAFKAGWSWMGDVVIGLTTIWPLLLAIFTAVIVYKKTRVQKVKRA